jgi:hypothetical protein
MTIGTGIAVAGIRVFAGMLGLSKQITSGGFLLGVALAMGFTGWVLVMKP